MIFFDPLVKVAPPNTYVHLNTPDAVYISMNLIGSKFLTLINC